MCHSQASSWSHEHQHNTKQLPPHRKSTVTGAGAKRFWSQKHEHCRAPSHPGQPTRQYHSRHPHDAGTGHLQQSRAGTDSLRREGVKGEREGRSQGCGRARAGPARGEPALTDRGQVGGGGEGGSRVGLRVPPHDGGFPHKGLPGHHDFQKQRRPPLRALSRHRHDGREARRAGPGWDLSAAAAPMSRGRRRLRPRGRQPCGAVLSGRGRAVR